MKNDFLCIVFIHFDVNIGCLRTCEMCLFMLDSFMGTMVRIWSLHCRTPIGISSRTWHDSWGKIWWVESTSYCVRYAATLSMLCSLFPSTYINLFIYTYKHRLYIHTNIDCSCITLPWEYAYFGSAFFCDLQSQINPVNSSSCLQDLHRCTLLAHPADKKNATGWCSPVMFVGL